MTPMKRPLAKHMLGDSRSRASSTGMVAMDDDQYTTSAK
jgi:hypothetical protein